MTAADDEVAPYPDSLAHVFDELRRLDALLRIRLEAWWAEREHETVDEFRGLYVADETVERLVYDRPDERSADGATRTERTDATASGGSRDRHRRSRRNGRDDERETEAARLATRIAARARRSLAADVDLRLVRLADDLDLGGRDLDVLLVALAPAVDPAYETLYSYLQDDVTETRPTVGLVLDLLCSDERDRVATRRLFAPDAPLRRHHLVAVEGEGDVLLPARRLRADDRIVEFLLGSDTIDPALSGVASYHEPTVRAGSDGVGERDPSDDDGLGSDDPSDDPGGDSAIDPAAGGGHLSPAHRATLNRLLTRDAPPMLVVSGPDGSGRCHVADAVSRARGTPRLAVDAAGVPEGGFAETLDRACREALLGRATLHVTNVDVWDDDRRSAVVERFDGAAVAVVLSGHDTWRPPRPPAGHAFAAIELSVPSFADRRRLWAATLGDDAGVADLDGLATKFRLTPGGIDDAVATARELAAVTPDGRLTEALLYRACRERPGQALDALGRKVEPTYGWDDIVLPDDRMTSLREIVARVTHRGRVYADWGFESRFSLGRGLVVLFTGPSGTGKTMAAEIVAADTGLDLYKVDVASVVSKYIGETEKNLGRVFDAAETTDAILLFDEADALFGKRTDVRDSHDRYANIEVDYLLQRIEEYEGTVILTTNLERNIDEAFRRRIHVGVDFPEPDREARAAIWERVFPAETPVDDLDVEFLSTLEFTGGNVKNVAVTAAFLAADDDEPVTMRHAVRAATREFRKTGRLVHPETFERYRDLLE